MPERPALPDGYNWQEVPEIGAAFPRPDGWFYRYEKVRGQSSCFITKEEITAGSHSQTFSAVLNTVKTGKGFETGITVKVLDKYARDGKSAINFARDLLTTRPEIRVLSEVEKKRRDPFMMFKAMCQTNPIVAVELAKAEVTEVAPIPLYVETVVNRNRNLVYVLIFESSAALWEQFVETGKIMIDNRIIDPRIPA